MNQIKLQKMANKLFLNINKKVASQLEKEYETLNQKIKLMKKIDTTNIKPMFRIDEKQTSFMREDIGNNVLPKQIIMKNAPQQNQEFIIIKRVVDND